MVNIRLPSWVLAAMFVISLQSAHGVEASSPVTPPVVETPVAPPVYIETPVAPPVYVEASSPVTPPVVETPVAPPVYVETPVASPVYVETPVTPPVSPPVVQDQATTTASPTMFWPYILPASTEQPLETQPPVIVAAATASPTTTPMASPSASPSGQPRPAPTDTPVALPSGWPSRSPTGKPIPSPTKAPVVPPSSPPSWSPTTGKPVPIPTDTPVAAPSQQPSWAPNASPSWSPSGAPNSSPSWSPSVAPNGSPSWTPTGSPSGAPNASPSSTPSTSPSSASDPLPTADEKIWGFLPPTPQSPTGGTPTDSPIGADKVRCFYGSEAPSYTVVSAGDREIPEGEPVVSTGALSWAPSDQPSDAPSDAPSSVPSDAPSSVPSDAPSSVPSDAPSTVPSDAPSVVPSDAPSVVPSDAPSALPSDAPSAVPSDAPSAVPSDAPSSLPSDTPSSVPSDAPSSMPSDVPSWLPSDIPSVFPKNTPPAASEDVVYDETMGNITLGWDEIGATCAEFLADFMPLVYPANYTDLTCVVVSQSLVNDLPNTRLLQEAGEITLRTKFIVFVLKAMSSVELPDDAEFQDVVMKTFDTFAAEFRNDLTEKSSVLLDGGDATISDGASSIVGDRSQSSDTEDTDGVSWEAAGAASVGGAVLALVVAFLILKRREQKRLPQFMNSYQSSKSVSKSASNRLSKSDSDLPYRDWNEPKASVLANNDTIDDFMKMATLPPVQAPIPEPINIPRTVENSQLDITSEISPASYFGECGCLQQTATFDAVLMSPDVDLEKADGNMVSLPEPVKRTGTVDSTELHGLKLVETSTSAAISRGETVETEPAGQNGRLSRLNCSKSKKKGTTLLNRNQRHSDSIDMDGVLSDFEGTSDDDEVLDVLDDLNGLDYETGSTPRHMNSRRFAE